MSNRPNPNNLSTWSLNRKKMISENKSLKEENQKLKVESILNDSNFIDKLSICKNTYLSVDGFSFSSEKITFHLSNYDLGYETEVEIPTREVLNQLENKVFDEFDLRFCIEKIIEEDIN